MPRPHRLQLADTPYHITARANRRGALYVDEYDRRVFVGICALIFEDHGWSALAWCLMTTHYHLVIWTRDADLAAGMHRINSRYADWFNTRHGLTGHVFERRYGSTVIRSDEHLHEAYRYLALNPVRAGACRHPSEWRWSSYPVFFDLADTTIAKDALYRGFNDGRRAREELRQFVEAPRR